MAIPIPITQSKIATAPWGIPITNEVNRLTALTTATAPGVYATAAARDAAIPVPSAGMQVFLTTPKQLTLFDGAQWLVIREPPQTFTPAFSGFSLGNGVVNLSRYQRTMGLCLAQLRVTMGSSSIVNGWLQVNNLPIYLAAGLSTADVPGVFGSSTDVSTSNNYLLTCVMSGSNAIAICWLGANNAMAFTGPTAPFTWAVGDIINWNLLYPYA